MQLGIGKYICTQKFIFPQEIQNVLQMQTRLNKTIRSQAFAMSQLRIILVVEGHVQALLLQTIDNKSSCPPVTKQLYIVMLHQSE